MCNLFFIQHLYNRHREICIYVYDGNDLCHQDARASDCFYYRILLMIANSMVRLEGNTNRSRSHLLIWDNSSRSIWLFSQKETLLLFVCAGEYYQQHHHHHYHEYCCCSNCHQDHTKHHHHQYSRKKKEKEREL
jgi:hypothetical protein